MIWPSQPMKMADIDSLVVLLLCLTTITIRVWFYCSAAAAELWTCLQKHRAWDHSPSSGGICLPCVGMNQWQLQNEPAAAISSPRWGGKASIPLKGQRCTLHFSIRLEMMQVSTHFRGHLDREAPAGWFMCDVSVHSASHMIMNGKCKYLEEASSPSECEEL